ncbi:NADP-dependent malic enzyme, partial [mine drainage metagenome]
MCLAIQQDPQLAHEYTSIDSTVAVITNGTAVLGLGNIGPLAGLPVMEGKAALFADLVGLSAVPILLEQTQPEKVVELICGIHLSFG